MEISFTSKEQSNKDQEMAFMHLSPSERLWSFFELMEQMQQFPTSCSHDTKDNFVVTLKIPS